MPEIEHRKLTEMEQREELLEQREERLPSMRAASWRQLKQSLEERYETESVIQNGAEIAERAQFGLDRLKNNLVSQAQHRPVDDLDVMIVQAFGFGAAERIQEFMSRPCAPRRFPPGDARY